MLSSQRPDEADKFKAAMGDDYADLVNSDGSLREAYAFVVSLDNWDTYQYGNDITFRFRQLGDNMALSDYFIATQATADFAFTKSILEDPLAKFKSITGDEQSFAHGSNYVLKKYEDIGEYVVKLIHDTGDQWFVKVEHHKLFNFVGSTLEEVAASGEDIFLYNVDSKKFLYVGNSWGTEASLLYSDFGLPITVYQTQNVGDDSQKFYTLKTHLSNQEGGQGTFLGIDDYSNKYHMNNTLYGDRPNGDMWIIEPVDQLGYANTYTLKLYLRGKITPNGYAYPAQYHWMYSGEGWADVTGDGGNGHGRIQKCEGNTAPEWVSQVYHAFSDEGWQNYDSTYGREFLTDRDNRKTEVLWYAMDDSRDEPQDLKYFRWQFVKRSELIAQLKGEAQGKYGEMALDATFLFNKDQGFARTNSDVWETTDDIQYFKTTSTDGADRGHYKLLRVGGLGNGNDENNKFGRVYQTIQLPVGGVYQLDCNGVTYNVHNNGKNDNNRMFVSYNNGTNDVTVTEDLIQHSDLDAEILSQLSTGDIDINIGKYIYNNGHNDNLLNSLYFFIPQDAVDNSTLEDVDGNKCVTVTFGFEKTNYGTSWIDNFRLHLIGREVPFFLFDNPGLDDDADGVLNAPKTTITPYVTGKPADSEDYFNSESDGAIKGVAENSIHYIQAKEGKTQVFLKRDFYPNVWHSLVLPFNVSGDKMREAFGRDVQVAEAVGLWIDPYQIEFKTVQDRSIEAGHYYIIKPSAVRNVERHVPFHLVNTVGKFFRTPDEKFIDLGIHDLTSKNAAEPGDKVLNETITDGFNAAGEADTSLKTGVTSQLFDEPVFDLQTGDRHNNIEFHGTYVVTYAPKDCYVLLNNGSAVANGTASTPQSKMYHYMTNTRGPQMKAFTWWITDVDPEEQNGAKALTMTIDGISDANVETVIDMIETDEASRADKNAAAAFKNCVYNVAGQVVRGNSTSIEGLPAGVYIVNGKKFVVK